LSREFFAFAEDFTYLVFFIGYQYYFALLKVYALFTLHVTAWGTRAGVGSAEIQEKADSEVDPDMVQVRENPQKSQKCHKSPKSTKS
jgi:hypothetical protein